VRGIPSDLRMLFWLGAGPALAAAAFGARLAQPAKAAPTGAVPVRVERAGEGYRLLRDGKPYFVRGAGGTMYLDSLQASGGNSIRTWGADALEPILGRAQELGLTVTVGIWLGQPRQGFNYGDAAQVNRQIETARGFIRRYRNHPAVLMWGLGNEMEAAGDDSRIWTAVNDLAKMAKQEDPAHPTMTVIAEIGESGKKARQFSALCPDVDVLGINSYAGLGSLSKRLKEAEFRRPYVVTEFGPAGHWEVAKTAWGAPVEPTSTKKAETYLANYQAAVQGQAACLGAYVFLWGHKQEATSTWFGMFLPSGERTAPVDAMTFAWTGKWPENRAPELPRVELAATGGKVAPAALMTAHAAAKDPDGDPLVCRWEVRSESTDRREGGDREAEPAVHPEAFVEAKGLDFTFRAPKREGAYRLFCYVYDGKGHAATANIPFLVAKP